MYDTRYEHLCKNLNYEIDYHIILTKLIMCTQHHVSTQLAGTMDAYDAQMLALQRAAAASASTTVAAPKTSYSREDLCSKEFQLEELEDKEECQTEVWLNDDGSITLGTSNGPLVTDYVGDWHMLETTGDFRMRLTRRFESPG